MKRSLSAICLLACLLMSGCQARQLLMWRGPSCSGLNGITIGTAQALAVPAHGLVLGQVHLRNNGPRPFGFQSSGVQLWGLAGVPLDCSLRCPQSVVPVGGALQCTFIAQAPQPQAFSSFQPFFVPQAAGGQCFNQQPFIVQPHASPAVASSAANAFSNAGVAKSFADACAQAFGAAYSDALSKATSWQGDAYSLANAIASSAFGPAVANSASHAQAWGGAASATGSAASNTAFGPAVANSASNALQSGFGGIAAAADKAAAFSGNGPAAASSQANALNAGGGPAVASASSTAVSGGSGCGSSCGK